MASRRASSEGFALLGFISTWCLMKIAKMAISTPAGDLADMRDSIPVAGSFLALSGRS
jgi:hypothetical protein